MESVNCNTHPEDAFIGINIFLNVFDRIHSRLSSSADDVHREDSDKHLTMAWI